MNKIFKILLIALLVVSCTSNTIIKKPDNLIPKDEMVDLLSDMLIAMGAEDIKNLNLERNVNYFPLVFEKYHIDSTRFKESNYYYISRIDDYEEILQKVDIRIKALKKEIDDERIKQDSIKNINNKYQKNTKVN